MAKYKAIENQIVACSHWFALAYLTDKNMESLYIHSLYDVKLALV